MEYLALVIGLAAVVLAVLLQVVPLCWRCIKHKPEEAKLPYEPFHDDVTTVTH